MSNFDYIVNPNTGRIVSINGAVGKKILNNYIYQIGGESAIENTPELPVKKKGFGAKARSTFSKIKHKAAEFERTSPKVAKALTIVGKGGTKTVLGLIPGGKSIASGLFNVGKVASKEAFKRSRSVRDNWWENHNESGTWLRNKNKADLQYSILDHDNNGFITREEYMNSVPGMHHPDADDTIIIKEKEKIRAKLIQRGHHDIHTSEELHTNEDISEIIKKQNKKVNSAVKKISAMNKIKTGQVNNSFANIAIAASAK